MFTEIQDPTPWSGRHEHARFVQSLEQAQAADRTCYGCRWQVEHHGAEEFSSYSAPETMLAAISQRTEGSRLGHAAALAPGAMNHPCASPNAPRPSTVSAAGGVEQGLTRSTAPEWRLFGIDPETVHSQTQEAFEFISRARSDRALSFRGPALPARRRIDPAQTLSAPASAAVAGHLQPRLARGGLSARRRRARHHPLGIP